jgi:hypothetical protein
MAELLSIAELKSLLVYWPETGQFHWKVSKGGMRAGSVAGSIDPSTGYIKIYVRGRNYYGHRLAWAFVHGDWPPKQMDHKNLDRGDNRIANLRPATNGQNTQNREIGARNTSGVRGVSWSRHMAKWWVQIVVDGKHYSLGYYADIEAARAARNRGVLRFHGEYGRLS